VKTSGVARIFEWGWGLAGSGGGTPSFRRPLGGLGDSPPEARGYGTGPSAVDFCNFLIKIVYFYAYFGQNRYFKAITHQLKEFPPAFRIFTKNAYFDLNLFKSKFLSYHKGWKNVKWCFPKIGLP